jgi:hypothetical protein
MSRLLTVLLTCLALGGPAQLFAKGATVKAVIKGFDLKAPIEVTDTHLLAPFNLWAGPGTESTVPGFNPNSPSFIVDLSYGSISNIPDALSTYEVSFYAKLPTERLAYVVYYMYDSVARHGYVYLPGRADKFYRLNTSTIYHGVEGHWFRAWSEWDHVAASLIKASLLPYDPGEPGVITGEVVNSDGRPVANARVYIKENGYVRRGFLRYLMTDRQGQFRFAHLRPGDYEVFATPPESQSFFTSAKQRVQLPQYNPIGRIIIRIAASAKIGCPTLHHRRQLA